MGTHPANAKDARVRLPTRWWVLTSSAWVERRLSSVFSVQGLPLSLNGVKRIMTSMDWGDAEDFVTIGAVGAEEASPLRLPDMATVA